MEKHANTHALTKRGVRVAHTKSALANIMEQVLKEISELVKADLLTLTAGTSGVELKLLI